MHGRFRSVQAEEGVDAIVTTWSSEYQSLMLVHRDVCKKTADRDSCSLNCFRLSRVVCGRPSLRRGPRGCLRSECCSSGESMTAPRVKLSLAPIHQPRT